MDSNSFHNSGEFCLLIPFVKQFDSDHARQNAGPDLDINCTALMVFLKDFFEKK